MSCTLIKRLFWMGLFMSHGGGLAIITRDDLQVKSHPLANSLTATSFEFQLFKLSSPATFFTILNIYHLQVVQCRFFLTSWLTLCCPSVHHRVTRCFCAVSQLCWSHKNNNQQRSSIYAAFPRPWPTRLLTDMGRSPTWRVGNRIHDAVSKVLVNNAGYNSNHWLVLAKVKFSWSARRTIESMYRTFGKSTWPRYKVRFFNSHYFLHPLYSRWVRWLDG